MTRHRLFADPTESDRRARVLRDGLIAVAEWERVNAQLTVDELARARARVADEISSV